MNEEEGEGMKSSDEAVEAPSVPDGNKSQTPPQTTPRMEKWVKGLIQAQKHRGRPYRCDWCGERAPEIRRDGPRICDKCWLSYIAKRRKEGRA